MPETTLAATTATQTNSLIGIQLVQRGKMLAMGELG